MNASIIQQNVTARKEAESLFRLMLELAKEEFLRLPDHGKLAFFEIAHAHFEKRLNEARQALGQTEQPIAEQPKKPTVCKNERNGLADDAIKQLEDLIASCEQYDFPPAAFDFIDSVLEQAKSMLETIEQSQVVTPNQERAIANWTHGVERWIKGWIR